MKRIAALLFLQCAVAFAQDALPHTDPLLMQRRLAAVLRSANATYEQGHFQEALGTIDSLEGPAARDLAVANLRGAILTKLGRYDEAKKIFQDILQVNPGYFPAAFNIAEIHFLSGDYEGALEIFSRLREADPTNEMLCFRVFLCQVLLGREADADKTAKTLTPAGLTPAWYYTQVVLARRQNDQSKARDHLRAALGIYGEDSCRFFNESLASAKL